MACVCPEHAGRKRPSAVEASRTILAKLESGDLDENWPGWLIARVLLREAGELIKEV